MTNRKKQYQGEVAFDYFGEIADSSRYYGTKYLKPENIQNGIVYLSKYDRNQHKWVLTPVLDPPAPFDIEYVDPSKHAGNIAKIPHVLMLPNFEFQDTLKYYSSNKNRYSTSFEFESVTTQKHYWFFQRDFDDVVEKMDKGIIQGTFTFAKRGTAYGIVML